VLLIVKRGRRAGFFHAKIIFSHPFVSGYFLLSVAQLGEGQGTQALSLFLDSDEDSFGVDG
jgi:hypothetical protein